MIVEIYFAIRITKYESNWPMNNEKTLKLLKYQKVLAYW